MSLRLEKLNKHIQRTFGEVLQQEADISDDVLITVSRVDTSANLQRATVWLSVFPPGRAQYVLNHLTQQMYSLQGAFNRRLDLHPLPRLILKSESAQPYEHA